MKIFLENKNCRAELKLSKVNNRINRKKRFKNMLIRLEWICEWRLIKIKKKKDYCESSWVFRREEETRLRSFCSASMIFFFRFIWKLLLIFVFVHKIKMVLYPVFKYFSQCVSILNKAILFISSLQWYVTLKHSVLSWNFR